MDRLNDGQVEARGGRRALAVPWQEVLLAEIRDLLKDRKAAA